MYSNKIASIAIAGTMLVSYAAVPALADEVKNNNLERTKVTSDTVSIGSTDWESKYTTSTNFSIDTLDGFKAFRNYVNAGNDFAGKTVILTKDLTLDEDNWTPIGKGGRDGASPINSSTPFKGNFDGQGHTISGLKIVGDSSTNGDVAIGLFGIVQNGKISNIHIFNPEIDLSNGTNELFGCAVGFSCKNSTVENIYCEGTNTLKIGDGAAIVGRMTVEGTIKNCHNYLDIIGTLSGKSVAGIVSKPYYTEPGKKMEIINCSNRGNITGKYCAGGIAGLSAANINNCKNTGTITANAGEAGGIVGEQTAYGNIYNNENTGNITGKGLPAGGIIGWVRYADYGRVEKINIYNNKNSGDIVSEGKSQSVGGDAELLSAGGIAGEVYNAAEVYNNENTARSIKGGIFASGIVGTIQYSSENRLNGKDNAKVNVYNNISSTSEDNITAGCKDLYAHDKNTKDVEIKVYDNGTKLAAKIGDENYATFAGSLKNLKDGETLDVLEDVVLSDEEWTTINKRNITINGNYKTIKVSDKNLKTNQFMFAGEGNTFKNIKFDLSEVKSSKPGVIDAGKDTKLENVEIVGEKDNGKNNCIGVRVAPDITGVEINGKNFEKCDMPLAGNTKVSKETAFNNSDITMSGEAEVSGGSSFKDCNIKIESTGNKINESKILGNTTIEFDGDAKKNPDKVDLTKNYWENKKKNSDKPKDEVFIGLGKNDKPNTGGAYSKPEDVNKPVEPPKPTPTPTPDVSPDTKPETEENKHEEIIGRDRYETAAKLADMNGVYDTVILVNTTETMSDGLSAAGLSGKLNAPVLPIKKNSIPDCIMERVNKVENVYIIGGENAISKDIEKLLSDKKVRRISGKNRYETSKNIANMLGGYKEAFVVNGLTGEADAMSISTVAAREKCPILVTNGKESIHTVKNGVNYTVVGGERAVSDSIEDKYSADRVEGRDRYATNRAIINRYYKNSNKLFIANGKTLVDALTASLPAKDNGVVLVSETSDNSILDSKDTVQAGGMDFFINFDRK